MKRSIATVFVLFVLAPAARAAVTAYSGSGAETMLIESKDGKSYLKLSGVDSKWADKVILVKKRPATRGDGYYFEYTEELSWGKRMKTYEIVVGADETLINGSLVPQVGVFYPGHPKGGGLPMHMDAELSKKSQETDLAGQYKKSPFIPNVD